MPKQTIPGNAVPIATRTVRLPGNPRLGNTQRARPACRAGRKRWCAAEKRRTETAAKSCRAEKAKGTEYPAATAAPLMPGREVVEDQMVYLVLIKFAGERADLCPNGGITERCCCHRTISYTE